MWHGVLHFLQLFKSSMNCLITYSQNISIAASSERFWRSTYVQAIALLTVAMRLR